MPLIVTIPPSLRKPLGDEGAEALAQLVNDATGAARDETIRLSDEKFERRLTEEIGKLRADLAHTNDMILLSNEKSERRLAEEMGKLRAEMHALAANTKTTIIFWIFGLWVLQMATMVVARFIG